MNRFCRLGSAASGLAAFAAAFAWCASPAAEPDSDVVMSIIVTRHGVRSPIYDANAMFGSYSADRWPQWTVPPGYLTPHGKRQMEMLGAYFRAFYVRAGLLSGRTDQDGGWITLRADSDERTIETARDLGAGLMPGAQPAIQARPQGKPDPLFSPVKAGFVHPDPSLAAAAVLGRMGGNPANPVKANAAAFATLERVLLGGDGKVPAGKKSVLDSPVSLEEVAREGKTISIQGTLQDAERCTDNFLLEYAEGMPLSDVGWGRLSRADLTELLRIHFLYFDLTQATFYPAQVQASNLASHILETLEQGATGRAVAGAVGGPESRLVMLVGHDTNLINLAGLLGISWWMDGTQRDPIFPGGSLVFELRRSRGDGSMLVRLFYVCQTLEQMRAGDAPTLENPPMTAPIFIPGCSGAAPGYDAPLDRVEALFHRVIDPQFVAPGSS
ncbi:MAG: histidine-type phosphatase [Opitutaceae bacterium]